MNTKLSSVSLLLDLRSISPEHKANRRHDNGTSNNNNNNDFSQKFGRRNSGYLRDATKAVAKIIGKSNPLRLFHSKDTSADILVKKPSCSLVSGYYTDPSGTFWQCNAKAIGSRSEGADSSLQEEYNKYFDDCKYTMYTEESLDEVMEEWAAFMFDEVP